MKKSLTFTALVIGALLGASALSVLAAGSWTPPTATPPNDNVAAPINVGSITQEKAAGLWLHGGLAVDGNLIIATGTPSAGKVLTAVDNTGTVMWGNGGGSSGIGTVNIRIATSTTMTGFMNLEQVSTS